MSGGMAFVLDELENFRAAAISAWSSLEKVTTTEDKTTAARNDHLALHVYGQPEREAVLDAWDATLPKFVKVMPVDYKRVLEERKKKAAAKQATT